MHILERNSCNIDIYYNFYCIFVAHKQHNMGGSIMKQFNFNQTSKMLVTLLCSIMIAFVFVSCEQNAYNPDNGKEDENTPNTFPFETTSSIQLNVKYDVPKGYKVLFEVYIENPFVLNQDGQAVKRTDISPVITRMTDGNGAYNGKEVITADRGSEVYIYTSYIGVPGLFKTVINDNVVNADINFESIRKAAPQTRAYTAAPSGYYTLGTWDSNGRPNYLDTEGELSLSTSILNTINNTLKEGEHCPDKYRQSIDFKVNDPKNRNAEVSVRFIGGTSSAASTFGYYCYRQGASLNEIKKAKKYIVFPNTFTMANTWNKPVALKSGDCVKLHYIDENGVDRGTEFPNGVSIGWFLINDAFNTNNGSGDSFHSTPSLNTNDNNRTHTAAFRINDFVVLSFEDWYGDDDYNDVMFNVWSNPIEAIAPEVPEVPEEKPEEGDQSIAYSMTYNGIMAFEDNWPAKGDYDLNDVIVKYHSVMRFNTKNEVLNTEDTFTALWSGASYKNGFAYQLNTDRSNVTTEFTKSPTTFAAQGLDKDIAKATINVFVNAIEETGNNTRTSTYKIKNTFATPVDHEEFGVAPYNPFIFVHSNLDKSRSEVHLINHAPTEKANMELFHTGNDLSDPTKGLYYVAAENYPFAIHLIDAEDFSTAETVSIDNSYPKFTNWVKSGGAEDKDWYK